MAVIENGIDPNYFLDTMTEWELDAMLIGHSKKKRDSWEQCRFLAYMTAITQGAKIKSPQDIMKFEWEHEKDKDPVIINKPTQDAIKQMALEFEKELKNNGNSGFSN